MKIGDRVAFIDWNEDGEVLSGRVEDIRMRQTGEIYIIKEDSGWQYELPERFIISKMEGHDGNQQA